VLEKSANQTKKAYLSGLKSQHCDKNKANCATVEAVQLKGKTGTFSQHST